MGAILSGGVGLARDAFLAGAPSILHGQPALRGDLGFQHALPAAGSLAEFLIEKSSFSHDLSVAAGGAARHQCLIVVM